MDAARAKISESVKIDVLPDSHVLDSSNATWLNRVARSFASDTITVPTKEMYAYAALASLGDDVYHDPSTHALEVHVAQLTGKEAGLFLPSGTMSNQIALRSHLKGPPHSVMLDARSHIYTYEAGGTAFHSGAASVAVSPENGHHITLADIEANVIEGDDVHLAPTRVIALENTLYGTIFPQDDIISISEYARSRDIKLHLDGARLWHVAAGTATPLKDLCNPFDSVSLCFSKGLGAPIGSCLVGTASFIHRARRLRKLFGGGMRQTGFMAACAAYALTHHFSRLPAVHALARRLQAGLGQLGANILSPAETCMLFYDPSPLGLGLAEISARASALPDPIFGLNRARLVLHIQTSERAVTDFLHLLKTMVEEKRRDGLPQMSTEQRLKANGTRQARRQLRSYE